MGNPKDGGKNGSSGGSDGTGQLGGLDQVLLVEKGKNTSWAQGGSQEDKESPTFPILSKDRKVLRSNKSCSFVTNVRFNPVKTYLILECGGSEIPYVALYSASPDASKLRLIQVPNFSFSKLLGIPKCFYSVTQLLSYLCAFQVFCDLSLSVLLE